MSNPVNIEQAVKLERLALEQAEAAAVAKYNGSYEKVRPGTIRRETEGTHNGKLTVEINTVGADGQLDGKVRRVATSDLFQVHHQPEVAKGLRKLRMIEKRATIKAFLAQSKSGSSVPVISTEERARQLLAQE